MTSNGKKLTLSEIFDIDGPDDKIIVSHETLKWMIQNQEKVATSAFIHVLCSRYENLPRISAERTLSKDWREHPMFGINHPDSTDQWALAYQETMLQIAEIKNIILERV